jgi:hypothetical protein
MGRLRRNRALGAVLGIVVLLMTALPVGAAPGAVQSSSDGITISPPLKEVVLGPGLQRTTPVVTVKNQSGSDFTASVRTVDFKALDAHGGISLDESGASQYSLAKWLTLPDGNTVSLKNGQTAEIPVQIDNRGDLAPGGHYGAIVLSADTAGGGNGNRVQLKQELVSLIFVKKLGGEKYGLELESLVPAKGSKVPESVTMRFRSTGNVHVVPRGYVEVTDAKGTVVEKGIINPESTLVMPGTNRQFITLLQPVNKGQGGRYKLTAYYRYDGQSHFAQKSVYLSPWTPPIWAIIVCVTGVICSILLYKKLHRSKRSKTPEK